MEALVVQYANHYFPLYHIDRTLSCYHHTISMITAQQIKFEAGKSLRQTLYNIAGYPLKPENIRGANLKDIKYLTHAKLFIIKAVTEIALAKPSDDDFMMKIAGIQGIGPWTLKGVLILTEKSPSEALYEDAYIKKRLGNIYGKKMSVTDCKLFFQVIPENSRSIVSYFLWRLKDSGAEKVRNNRLLERNDFL